MLNGSHRANELRSAWSPHGAVGSLKFFSSHFTPDEMALARHFQ
jgi:hypothetical protein